MGPEQLAGLFLLWNQWGPVLHTAGEKHLGASALHLDSSTRAPQSALPRRLSGNGRWRVVILLEGLSIRCSLGLYPHGEAILLGLAHPSICGWPWLPSAAAGRHGRRQLLSRASCLSLSHPSSVPPLHKHTVIPRAHGTKGPFGFLFFPNLPCCFVLFFLQTHYSARWEGDVLRLISLAQEIQGWERELEREDDNAVIPLKSPWHRIPSYISPYSSSADLYITISTRQSKQLLCLASPSGARHTALLASSCHKLCLWQR